MSETPADGDDRPRSSLLVVGEALVDLVPEPGRDRESGPPALHLRGAPGGSPANVAVGLARLGVPVGFAGRFSERGFGPWRRSVLAAEGIDLGPSVPADQPSTVAAVTLDPAGAASYEFYGPDTADWWWSPGELPAPDRLRAGAVHTGSLATALQPGAAVLADWVGTLRAGGEVLVSYDPNVRPSIVGGAERCREATVPFLACAHLVKVSEEDLGVLFPGRPAEDAVAAWLAGDDGPSLVTVTRGAAGCVALHRDGRRLERPAPAVEIADTIGAGDAFTAGLLAGLWSAGALSPGGVAGIADATLAAALDQANLVAALTCARPGADPPSAAELVSA